MAEEDLHRWDEKHRSARKGEEPAAFLLNQIARLPKGGRALDVAAGGGRNSFFLARQGFFVEAIDISPSAVSGVNRLAHELGLPVKAIQQDLDTATLKEDHYDLVIDFNYLNRGLVPKLKAALSLGGFVIFETFTLDQKEIGHPRNPLYLLRPNELLELFRDFRILSYREGLCSEQGEERFVASLFAQKWGQDSGNRS
jgi:SAM-dependent methyltransferase